MRVGQFTFYITSRLRYLSLTRNEGIVPSKDFTTSRRDVYGERRIKDAGLYTEAR